MFVAIIIIVTMFVACMHMPERYTKSLPLGLPLEEGIVQLLYLLNFGICIFICMCHSCIKQPRLSCAVINKCSSLTASPHRDLILIDNRVRCRPRSVACHSSAEQLKFANCLHLPTPLLQHPGIAKAHPLAGLASSQR